MDSTQNDQSVDIAADDRERVAEVITFLRRIPGVCVRVERLAAGDNLADRRILFERKTLQDFAISIVDGRLFKQMAALVKIKPKAVLILEGTGKDADSVGVRRESLQGALITISLLMGIPVLRSMTPEETARLIVYAARQVRSLGKACIQRSGYRPRTKRGRQIHILQGLPGVGPERATRLLDTFGSVEAVMCAGGEDLMAIDGIGARTAERIRWAVSENLELYGTGLEPSIYNL